MGRKRVGDGENISAGGQVLESVDFSEDGKIDTLQQHVKGEGFQSY